MIKNIVKASLITILLTITLIFGTNVKASSIVTVDELPNTTGSFYKTEGTMGTASFEVDGTRVVVKIRYNAIEYRLNYYMSDKTDMSLFTNYREVFYYTDNREHFLVINYSERYDFFKADGTKTETFNPHVIWNLDTNEFQKIDRFTTYIHMDVDKAKNLFAYFYVDEFLIDQLLTASIMFQFKYKNLLGTPKGDWIDRGMLLSNENHVKVVKHGWQYKYLATSLAVGNVINAIPGFQLPAAALGTAAALWAIIAGPEAVKSGIATKTVQEIEKLPADENQSLRRTLNNLWYTADPTFDGINQGYNIFQLNLGNFQKRFSAGIDWNKEYSSESHQKGLNIIEFTYMTDGVIYKQDGANIDVVVSFGDGLGSKEKAPRNYDWLVKIIAVLVLLLLGYAGLRSGAFTDGQSALKFILAVAILAIAFVIIYYGIIGGSKFLTVLLL